MSHLSEKLAKWFINYAASFCLVSAKMVSQAVAMPSGQVELTGQE